MTPKRKADLRAQTASYLRGPYEFSIGNLRRVRGEMHKLDPNGPERSQWCAFYDIATMHLIAARIHGYALQAAQPDSTNARAA